MNVSTEPVVIANSLKALLVAIAPLGTLFGWWNITPDQLAGITVAVVAVGEFVATVFARSKVTPMAGLPLGIRHRVENDAALRDEAGHVDAHGALWAAVALLAFVIVLILAGVV